MVVLLGVVWLLLAFGGIAAFVLWALSPLWRDVNRIYGELPDELEDDSE